MMYIDANIFILAILYKNEKCKKILSDIVYKQIQACTSVLTWNEIVYTLRKHAGRQFAINEGKKFLNFPNLAFIEANESVLRHAQHFITQYDVDPMDAIHVASALFQGTHEFISNDSDFDKIKEIKRIRP